jgi:dipeptidyl aminopeptidase/acylaminoacyl peptidase
LVDSGTNPEKESMEPFAYFVQRVGKTGNIESASGSFPRKATNVNRYLVTKQSAKEFPNLYVTDDFRTYRAITDIHPEKEYNWLTAELVNWQMSDGQPSQGILYKPENFDSTKKYPLIFTYYEKRSDELNRYIEPDFSFARINIPYYVSSGYLVFVPDIYYKPGHNGQGVLNAVISAARSLKSFSYVDSTRLGLQGHSFAGWETNFLITHSNLFAAACEASGVSDQVSAYGQLNMGYDRQDFYEKYSQGSPYGQGVTPWTNPNLYIENSPVFYVDKVTTPLLMMHGDEDGAVPYAQAIEMFLALRRAGKTVWLLQYEKAGHILSGKNAGDFTIRMKQFFDYYLKNTSPPAWMKLNTTDR